jgi:hypothetical protein
VTDVGWRRKPSSDVTARRDAVTTGVILARLDSVVDRLEGVYQQMAAAVEQLPPPKEDERG